MANMSGGSSGGAQSPMSCSTCCTFLGQQASCWPCSRLAYKRSNVIRSGCVDIICRGSLASFSKRCDSLSFRRCSSLPSRWPAFLSFASGRAWLPLLCTILPLQACCSTKCLNGASFQLLGQLIGITCNQIALVCGWHSAMGFLILIWSLRCTRNAMEIIKQQVQYCFVNILFGTLDSYNNWFYINFLILKYRQHEF
jgi:hypothetical protein